MAFPLISGGRRILAVFSSKSMWGSAAAAAASSSPLLSTTHASTFVAFPSPSVSQWSSSRSYASQATSKLMQTIQAEIQNEKSTYEEPPNQQKFLKTSGWTFLEKRGDVNMQLSKNMDGKKVTVEFQLVSPFQAEGSGGSGSGSENNSNQSEMTDFSVSVEKPDGRGVTFYCTTLQNDDKFRYMIGNVRYFSSPAEKDSVSGYNGPEFEDLDETLQEGLDEWLASLGVESDLCDFIDACAIDKEQKEYTSWLESLSSFLEK